MAAYYAVQLFEKYVEELSDPVNDLLLGLSGRCARNGVSAFLDATHAEHDDRGESFGYLKCLTFLPAAGISASGIPAAQTCCRVCRIT
jgi:hypothetical protein